MTLSQRERNDARHLGLSRPERLRAGKAWASQWGGNNIVKDYAHHFGVDHLCAAGDLKSLLRAGVRIDPAEAERVNRKVAHQQRKRVRRSEKLNRQPEPPLVESDERFAYIVGRTAWGFPFGVTWQEMGGEEPATAPGDLTGGQPHEDAKKKNEGFPHDGEAA